MITADNDRKKKYQGLFGDISLKIPVDDLIVY